MDKPTIKILMIKGEKGDAYDDSELRAEIEATLANNAYVQFVGDGELELPVHSINDSVTSNTSTWSSEKIKAEYPEINYTINGATITCDKTYSEIVTLLATKTPKINIKHGVEVCLANYIINVQLLDGLVISAKNYDGKITIEHKNDDTITVTFTTETFQNDIDALEEKVTPLWDKRWIPAGQVTSSTASLWLDFSGVSYSTMLILVQNNDTDEDNILFIARKTMTEGANATVLACAGTYNFGVQALVRTKDNEKKVSVSAGISGHGGAVFYQLLI